MPMKKKRAGHTDNNQTTVLNITIGETSRTFLKQEGKKVTVVPKRRKKGKATREGTEDGKEGEKRGRTACRGFFGASNCSVRRKKKKC